MSPAVEQIRRDFSILTAPQGDGKRIVYLDSACQARRPKQVVGAVTEYYDGLSACGMSGVTTNSLARATTEACARAREKMAGFLGARVEETVWQPNATYGMNFVVRSLALTDCPADLRLQPGDEVLTTDLEHHSSFLPVWLATRESRVRHRVVQVDENGELDPARFQERLGPRTRLVCIAWSSSMTGSTVPLREIVRIAREHGALVLVDGAQYVPHRQVDVRRIEMDFLAISVHKMCGPAGMGVLYGRSEILSRLPPSIVGGETVSTVRLEVSAGGEAWPRVADVREEPHLRAPGSPRLNAASQRSAPIRRSVSFGARRSSKALFPLSVIERGAGKYRPWRQRPRVSFHLATVSGSISSRSRPRRRPGGRARSRAVAGRRTRRPSRARRGRSLRRRRGTSPGSRPRER